MNEYIDYLNITVIQENKPVTYKSLARSLGIHVNTAKQVLYEFSKNQSKVFAVYCITGIALQNDQFKIQLVKESEVEETKHSYKEVTGIHVYSVAAFDPNDFSVFYSAYKDLPRLAVEDRVKCGTLKNNHILVKNISSDRLTENKSQIMATTAKLNTNISSKPAAMFTPKSTTPSKSTSTSTSTASKRKGTLSWGPAVSKKQAIETPEESKPDKEAFAKKPVEKPTPKPVATKRHNENDDIEKRMAKASIKASDIFSDDEEDNEEPQPQPIEDLKNEDDDLDMEDIADSKEDEEPPAKSPPPVAPGKNKRRVLKKKTTQNARGFLVTEEVWEWESASEDESKPANDPITTKKDQKTTSSVKPQSKKSTNAKKPGTQSNLLNFFKKA